MEQEGGQMNLCLDCPVMDYAPCKILEIADKKGLEGMSKCEMHDAIKEIIKDVRNHKQKRGRR